MNIVYLLGNGFDINLGMKTRYNDFYENYLKKESKSTLVEKLKSNIFDNVVNWSDLELALGKYTTEFQSVSDFDEVYDDIVNNLCDYLDEESATYDFSSLRLDIFLKNLCYPELFLTEADINEFFTYKKKWRVEDKKINIINFNYTKSVKKIIEKHNFNTPIETDGYSKYYLKELLHIHGFTNERTILGVNDLSQVGNTKFYNDTDFIEALIKIESNSSLRHNVDKKSEQLINHADLICIFGCSLGETDKYWWQLIATNLRRGIKVIIFFRTEEQNRRLGHKVLRVQRAVKKLFLDMSDLNEEDKEKFGQNLYIKINAEIFQLTKNEQSIAS
ncbi:AbiH family protein [Acinetobacter variabilis]|uniref:AbiH family protein n=1 Tax=Acinetobacter TaxID=469 RepID=UPI00054CC5D6|nr:AbiH family protein [Acinetobacter sp. YZS-X1-1]